jgi:glutathione-regulated potassium-efflux system protein KefB
MARLALLTLGRAPSVTERAIAFFNKHDAEQLEAQYAVWQDEARLIETTRAAAEQLRELFETDMAGFEPRDRGAEARRT